MKMRLTSKHYFEIVILEPRTSSPLSGGPGARDANLMVAFAIWWSKNLPLDFLDMQSYFFLNYKKTYPPSGWIPKSSPSSRQWYPWTRVWVATSTGPTTGEEHHHRWWPHGHQHTQEGGVPGLTVQDCQGKQRRWNRCWDVSSQPQFPLAYKS